MLLRREALLLAGELLQGPDDPEPGVARFDDIVDVAFLSSLIRVAEEFVVFGLLFGLDLLLFGRILDRFDFL